MNISVTNSWEDGKVTNSHLLGSHTVSIRALCNSRHVCHLLVCLSRVKSLKLSETGMKFCHLYRKLGSPSKNMTSNFARKVAKYHKSSPKPRECASLLLHSISDAVCFDNVKMYANVQVHLLLSLKKPTLNVVKTFDKDVPVAYSLSSEYKLQKYHLNIITEILQRFFDKFWRKAKIFIKLQTRGLYSPVSIGISTEVSKSIGTETVSRQLLFHQTDKVNLR